MATRERVRENSRRRYASQRVDVEQVIAAVVPARAIRRRTTEPKDKDPQQPVVARPERTELADPPTPPESPREEATAGRGGPQHKYLQSLICQHAQSKGFIATVEATVGKAGRVDVLLERGETVIAVEISVTTSAAHEVDNIRKCLNAGLTDIVVIAPRAGNLRSVRARAESELGAERMGSVRFLKPEELLAALPEPLSPDDNRVLGYRVKTRLRPISSGGGGSQREVVAKTIAQALRRLRRS